MFVPFALTGCGEEPAAEGDASADAAAGKATSGTTAGDSAKYFAKNVIAAWEQAGAQAGWIRHDLEGNLWFREGTPAGYGHGVELKDDLPAFRFENWQEGVLADLPAPAIGFALDLSLTGVTDEAMANVARFETLRGLDLESTDIGDAGVKELTSLEHLRSLNLHNAELTEEGLKSLMQIQSLRYVDLQGLRVSRRAIYRLQNALPTGAMLYYR